VPGRDGLGGLPGAHRTAGIDRDHGFIGQALRQVGSLLVTCLGQRMPRQSGIEDVLGIGGALAVAGQHKSQWRHALRPARTALSHSRAPVNPVGSGPGRGSPVRG
jgi:hypothetical protein